VTTRRRTGRSARSHGRSASSSNPSPPASAPVVTSFSPSQGASTGGTVVTVVGTGFTNTATSTLGAVTFVSSTQIRITTSGGSGNIGWTVTASGYTSATKLFFYIPTLLQLSGLISTGQSLSVGDDSTPASTTPAVANVMLHDSQESTYGWYWGSTLPVSIGTYMFADPANGYVYQVTNAGTGITAGTQPTWPTTINSTVTDGNGVVFKCAVAANAPLNPAAFSASTLSFTPLVAPERPLQATNQQNLYPTNLGGECTSIAAANQFYALTQAPMAVTDVGIGGSTVSGISPGGGNNSWVSMEFEIQQINALAQGQSKSYGVPFFMCTNGEADAQSSTFVTDSLAYYNDIQSLVTTTTSQSFLPLAIISQQGTTPPAVTGPPISALGQLFLSRVYGSTPLILSGPKYQYPYTFTTGQHLTATGYQQNGEKSAEAALTVLKGGSWLPLAPNGITVSGSVVTIAFDVQFSPLEFNTTLFGQPHQTAPLSLVWANSYGFEALQGIANIIGATKASPIVYQTAQPHGLTTGNVVSACNVMGNAKANSQQNSGNAAVTVIDSTHFSMPYSGVAAYQSGGQVRLAVIGATNASPIVIQTGTPHGLATNSVVAIDSVLGNTAANGNWEVTVVDSAHFSLNGSTGNGAWTAAGGVFQCLPITSAAISGSTVQLTLPAAPGNGVSVAAALTPDDILDYAGVLPTRRCANLTDSDPFVGSITGLAAPNYVCTFLDPLPYSIPQLILSVSPVSMTNTPSSPQLVTVNVNRTVRPNGATVSGVTVDGVSLTGITTPTAATIQGYVPAGTYTGGTGNVVVTWSDATTATLTNGFAFVSYGPLLFFYGRLLAYLDGRSSVAQSAGVVTAWNDLSPFAQNFPAVGSPTYNASGSTPTAQPTVSVSSGNYLEVTSFNFSSSPTNGFSVIVLLKTSSTGSAEIVASGQGADPELRISSTQTTHPEIIKNSGTALIWGSATLGAWHVYAGGTTGALSGNDAFVTVDNATPVTSTNFAGTAMVQTSTMTIGARAGGSVPINAEVAFVVIVSGLLSSTDLSEMQTWATGIWGAV